MKQYFLVKDCRHDRGRDDDHGHDDDKGREDWRRKKERAEYKKELYEYKAYVKEALERLAVAVPKFEHLQEHLQDDLVDAARKLGKHHDKTMTSTTRITARAATSTTTKPVSDSPPAWAMKTVRLADGSRTNLGSGLGRSGDA